MRNPKSTIMRKSKSIYPLVILFLIGTFAVSCSKDDDNASADNSGSTLKSLAIRAVSTGSGDFEISNGMSTSPDAQGVDYCYKKKGCIHLMGSGAFTVFSDMSGIIDHSSPDEEGRVIGVKVSLHIDAGSGYFEVVRGKSYRSNGGFSEFDAGDEVVFKSETFSEGDLVEFSWGETD